MTGTTKSFLAALLGAFVLGCVGEVPPRSDDGADVDVDAGGGDGDEALAVNGTVSSYFPSMVGGAAPLAAQLASDGITPPVTATSAADGAYTLPGVPADSQLFVTATATGFLPTRNEAVLVVDQTITAPLYAVATADADRQFASTGAIAQPGTALLVIDLHRNNGEPLIGVTQADVALLDGAAAPIALDPAVNGPFFVAADGDAAPIGEEAASAVYLGKARTVLLNVTPGTYSLRVTFLDGNGDPQQTVTAGVVAVAGGATLVRSQGAGGGGGGGGGGT